MEPFYQIIISSLSILVTLLIGWHIYSAVSINKVIKKEISDIKEKFELKHNDLTKWFFMQSFIAFCKVKLYNYAILYFLEYLSKKEIENKDNKVKLFASILTEKITMSEQMQKDCLDTIEKDRKDIDVDISSIENIIKNAEIH
ncbi:MAG: hypothetical protein LBF04_02155 [Prevotellaceae bacterium]|jgi:hypothetical protein|nr:hypothetical protein [Prevotellaceae bacterium]